VQLKEACFAPLDNEAIEIAFTLRSTYAAAATTMTTPRPDEHSKNIHTQTHSAAATTVAAEESLRLRYLGRSGYDAGQCGALLAGGPLARDSLEAGPVWQTVVLLARAACGQRKLRISSVSHAQKQSQNLRTSRCVCDKNP
jgi:hypothetical protein